MGRVMCKNILVHCFLLLQHQEKFMQIPCPKRLPFIVSGLAFLQPALTNSQFYNLTLVAAALVLGGKFNFTRNCFTAAMRELNFNMCN